MKENKENIKESCGDVEDEKPEVSEKDEVDETEGLSELEQLELQLKEKEQEVSDFKDRYLRLQAETENFKRRIREEKLRETQFANERLIKNVLPMYENLGRALEAPDVDSVSLKEGVDMIFKEFTATLEKEKVKPIPTVGQPFDPAIHEALSQVESVSHEDQTILEEVSRGFYINERVLRPARVVITKKPSSKENEKLKKSESEEPDPVGKSGEEN